MKTTILKRFATALFCLLWGMMSFQVANAQTVDVAPFVQTMNKEIIIDRIAHEYDKEQDFIESVVEWSENASKTHRVPFSVILGVISVESSFRAHVVSHKGAVGIAQIMPVYWEDRSYYDIHTVQGNIMTSAYILDHYRDWCGHLECAIKSYYIGIGNYLEGRLTEEANQYYDRVMQFIERYSWSVLVQQESEWNGNKYSRNKETD